MVEGYRQQIALQDVALQFGRDSVEYRAAENAQTREALALDLERQGIARNSDKAKDVLRAYDDAAGKRELGVQQAITEQQAEQQRARQDGIDALRLELVMLGATTAEQTRAKAIAEAEIEIRKGKLKDKEAELALNNALAKAEGEIAVQRARAVHDQAEAIRRQQVELALIGQSAEVRARVSGS